jgi:predicted  nucleic acid-binding Zn-ribbon protein
MSITQILARHRALTEQTAKALSFGTGVSARLHQSVSQQESHIDRLKRRIESLQQTRGVYNKQIDDAIKALTDDVAAATRRLETDRRTLAPLETKGDRPSRDTAPERETGDPRPPRPTPR